MARHRSVFRRRRNSRRGLWRAALITFLSTLFLLVSACAASACSGTIKLPGSGAELSSRDIREMIHRGDYARADSLFDEIQQEIERRKRSHWDACKPYSPFATTDPEVAGDVDGWIAANPESLHAHMARAAYNHHLGGVYRGTDTINKVSNEQLRQWKETHRKAIEDYFWVLKRKPEFAQASANLMGLMLLHGSEEAIDRLFEDANRLTPDSGPLYQAYANTFLPWWRSESPMEVASRLHDLLEEIEEKYAENPEFNWTKGYFAAFQADLFTRQRNYPAAIGYYTTALEQNERGTFYLLRAENYLLLKKKNEALQDISRAEELYGERRCGSSLMARLYQSAQMTEKALKEYADLLACDPLNPKYLSEHALLSLATGRKEEAKADLDKMLVYGAASPEYQVNRGWALRLVDKKTADAAFLEAIRLSDGGFHFVGRYMDFLIASRSCRSLELAPAYLKSCVREGECRESEAALEAKLRRIVSGPCGAQAGPPVKKPLPLPADPIPG